MFSVDSTGAVSIKNNDQLLLIPRIGNGEAIIEKAHHWGHFQLDSTIERLQTQYFWTSMTKHFDAFIKKCTIIRDTPSGATILQNHH